MFKSLVGHGHVDFSTNQQQDAQEYFLHLMDLLEKTTALKELFEFQFEDRIQCLTSNKVSYIRHNDIVVGLPIPLEAATNKQEHEAFEKRKKEAEQANERLRSEDVVRLNIPMGACWEQFMSEEIVTDFYSNAIRGKSNAIKTVRFKTFPDYLVVQLRKFTISEDWTPKKLDVTVEVLEELDLSYLRSTGKQPHEEEQPASEEDGQAQEVSLNEEYIAQLMDMGFPLDACKRAVHSTNNSGIEAAMNWVFEHSQDPDFAAPFEVISSKGSGESEAKYEDISQIVALGFNEIQARNALLKFKNNLEQALEFLFEHPGEVSSTELDTPSDTQENKEKKCKDGPAKYHLFAFVSHMGTSTSCGHYICHIKKDGKWVIFNDRKVALSEQPPKNLGYLYFYKRVADAS